MERAPRTRLGQSITRAEATLVVWAFATELDIPRARAVNVLRKGAAILRMRLGSSTADNGHCFRLRQQASCQLLRCLLSFRQVHVFLHLFLMLRRPWLAIHAFREFGCGLRGAQWFDPDAPQLNAAFDDPSVPAAACALFINGARDLENRRSRPNETDTECARRFRLRRRWCPVERIPAPKRSQCARTTASLPRRLR